MDAYTVLSTLVLLLSGWLAGAESASWALLQPVVARLDDTPQIRMQQGMLRTFGRVMPILLPLTSVLIVLTAVVAPNGTPRVLWLVAAVAAAVLIAFTLAVNVPLNDQLKAAGDPDRIADLAAVRERFNEARWVGWNLVRAIASTVAFGCLSWALVLYGRTVTPGGP